MRRNRFRSAPASAGRRLSPDGGKGDAGYAAVDALVALTILATTISFSLVALHVAARSAAAAVEVQQARAELAGLLERAATKSGLNRDASAHFTWTLDVRGPAAPAGGVALCEQEARVRANASGRLYRMSSAALCIPEAKP